MKNKKPGMTMIVKTTARFTVGLILIYGVYIVFQGHSGPGGGFAGGVIITLSLVNLMLAFGKDAVLKRLDKTRGLFLAGLGALIFLLINSFGIRAPGLSEAAIAVMVSSGLFVIFLVLALLITEEKRS